MCANNFETFFVHTKKMALRLPKIYSTIHYLFSDSVTVVVVMTRAVYIASNLCIRRKLTMCVF